MLLKMVAAGTRMPAWVVDGFGEYASRLRGEFRLELVEIPLGQRGRGDTRRAVATEGERMLAAAGQRSCLIAMQVEGRALSTEQLARWLGTQAGGGRTLVFCIGGPDGLAPGVVERAELQWSLSALTLPHGLARVVVAEALYRAITVLKGLPYHRA
jgi:23S rRNA (pseudouridine1915-N3)-methyltransferase